MTNATNIEGHGTDTNNPAPVPGSRTPAEKPAKKPAKKAAPKRTRKTQAKKAAPKGKAGKELARKEQPKKVEGEVDPKATRPVHKPKHDAQYHIEQVRKHGMAFHGGFFGMAQAMNEAYIDLTGNDGSSDEYPTAKQNSDWSEFADNVGLPSDRLRKYRKVGRCAEVMDAQNYLPPSLTTCLELVELTKENPGQLEVLTQAEQPLITPQSTRKHTQQVRAFLAHRREALKNPELKGSMNIEALFAGFLKAQASALADQANTSEPDAGKDAKGWDTVREDAVAGLKAMPNDSRKPVAANEAAALIADAGIEFDEVIKAMCRLLGTSPEKLVKGMGAAGEKTYTN